MIITIKNTRIAISRTTSNKPFHNVFTNKVKDTFDCFTRVPVLKIDLIVINLPLWMINRERMKIKLLRHYNRNRKKLILWFNYKLLKKEIVLYADLRSYCGYSTKSIHYRLKGWKEFEGVMEELSEGDFRWDYHSSIDHLL